jgi:uncharacterized protein (DUF169 family)
MAEVKTPDNYDISAAALKELAGRLIELLRIRTIPIGMKLFETASDMEKIPGLRRPTPGVRFAMCQLVTQSRTAGFTLGITPANLQQDSNCGGVVGLNAPAEQIMTGELLTGVWFANQEAARAHQAQMIRVAPGCYSAVVVSPLRAARLDPPDIVLFYATPAQAILFVNGLQWKRYRRYDMTIAGESACSDSWGRALKTGETSISIPCYAERRYGGVAEDELLLAMSPEEFARGIEGLEGLAKNGFRYPIPPYSAQADPSAGMTKSYTIGKSA